MKKVHMYKAFAFLLAFFISATAGATAANAQTSSSMACANIAVNLKYPMTDAGTGGAVTILQNFLKSAGYLTATPNGLFGPQTRNAVSAFQRQYNIPASPAGYVGPLTREKIRDISCNPNSSVVPPSSTDTGNNGNGQGSINSAAGIVVASPTRYDRYTAGGTITVTIDNAIPNVQSNPALMSYSVDLVRGDTVFQRFGTIYATTPGRKTSTFTLSSALNKDFSYKIKVTPSCTVLSSPQCRQALSSEFTIFDIANGGNTGSTGAAMIDITSPTSGTVAAGGSFAYQSTISSDKVYSLSFYLIPQSGAALSGSGSYYDSVSGGYSLGSFTPNNPVSNVSTTIPVPTDIPAGTYKVRVYLRPAGETDGSPTQWSALAYDESGVITVTNPNTPANTNTGTNTGTGNTATNLIYLASTPFKLLSFNGDFTTPMQTPSLTFTSNGTGNGTLTANICNSMSGSFTRTGNVITAPNLTSTMMACTAAIVGPAETSFVAMMASGATVSLENGRMVLTRNNGDKFVFAYDTMSNGTAGTTGTNGATAAEASSTNPYLRVTAPVAGFTYASTSPDINMTWVFGNLAKFRHYGFQVQLQNKLSPGQWEVMVPQTTVTATGTPVKITNEIVNRFVTRTGKTKEELKSGYFLKVFGLGYGTYPPNNTSYIDAESPTFTITPW